jgi:hypothetical protein
MVFFKKVKHTKRIRGRDNWSWAFRTLQTPTGNTDNGWVMHVVLLSFIHK